MTEKQAAEALLRTIWRNILSTVDSATRGVRDGQGREITNPFTGKPARLSVPESALRFREALQQRDVAIDTALITELTELLQDVAALSHFSLLADFDGEGGFDGGARLHIQTDHGVKVPTYLHEVFHQYEPTASEPE